MAESETSQRRQDATGTGLVGGVAHGLLDRVRVVLGGRDHKAEVEGYRLAVKGAESAQVGLIADRLLELARTDAAIDALTVVAGIFNRLDTAKRERALITGHGLWGKVIGGPAIDVDPSVRLSACVLIGRACESETFGWLRGLLGDQDKTVAEAAGVSLLAIARRAASSPPQAALDGETRWAVERLVVRCVREFDLHRRREALGALLMLCETPASLRGAGVELKEWLADEEHPAHMAMRGLIRRGEAAGVSARQAAWVWMGHPTYRAACVERILAPLPPAVRDTNSEWIGVLERGHLILNPMRQEGLRTASDRPARGQPVSSGLPIADEDIARLPAAAQARLAAWTTCTSSENLADALEPLLGAPSIHARLNALRAAAETANDDGTAMALDFCFDTNERIARSGLLRAAMGARASTDSALTLSVRSAVAALSRSEHDALRETAGTFGAMLDAMDESTGRLEARRLLRGNRGALVKGLQTMIRSGAATERVRAIRLASRLRLGADMELELLGVIGRSVETAGTDAPGEVMFAASAAVTALADLSSPAAQHAVHKCLHHPDARVRANALDAMARAARRGGWIKTTESPLARAIIEFKDDPHHRIRAGAARASLMAETRAHPTSDANARIIVPLLRDERPMHRVSGLWLAERTPGDDNLAATIADMVRTDPSPEVRIRARRAAERMLAGMARI